LEALIRVSESLAKMRLDGEVRAEDVAEALRLFRVSTMTANAADSNRNQQAASSSGLAPLRNTTNTSNTSTLGAANASTEESDRTENFVRSRLTLGGSLLNKQKLLEEASGQGYDARVVARVLGIMVMRGQVQERNQGRLVERIK
jgi:DNA replication licensing factor MCM5